MCEVFHVHYLSLMRISKPFPPANAIFAAFAILLAVGLFHQYHAYLFDALANQAVKDVSKSYDTLVDLFESIGNFLSRLGIYTTIPLTTAMKDVIVKIMAEVLSTLALATKEVKQGRSSGSLLADAGL